MLGRAEASQSSSALWRLSRWIRKMAAVVAAGSKPDRAESINPVTNSLSEKSSSLLQLLAAAGPSREEPG